MTKEFTYTIKLDFEPNPKNPSRLFQAMADLINNFYEIDILLAQSINSGLKTTQTLSDLRYGSILGTIKGLIEDPDQETAGGDLEEEQIERYFGQSKNRMLQAMQENQNIDNLEIVNRVSEQIDEIAEETGVKRTVTYARVESLKIAHSLDNLSKSVQNLSTDERASFVSSNEDPMEVSKTCRVDESGIAASEQLEELRTDSEMILKIKKPDFLGNSMWEMYHDGRIIRASILDETWLNRFHRGIEQIAPGTSLRVRIREIYTHDGFGNVVASRHEIYQVIATIRPSENSTEEIIYDT